MSKITPIDWKRIKAVAFDVDGTLYDQSRMRKKMLKALLSYYLVRPWRINELRMLMHFRQERETRSGFVCDDLENAQYVWCAEKRNYSIPQLKKVVEYWMFQYPNRFLPKCIFPGTQSFLKTLKSRGYRTAIYSDYKAVDKLRAMDLEADLVLSSTDAEIDRLKPDPKALLFISEHFNVAPEQCLFIGDRHELDAQCAINAGWQYLIIGKKPSETSVFFKKLEEELMQSTDTPVTNAMV